jgi:2'-5' RNA ligase
VATLVRLFVALEVPDSWRTAAGEVRLALETALDAVPEEPDIAARLRWVAPELLHLTLRFIGEVDQEQSERVQEALDAVGSVDLALSLGAVGTFGSAARTQVVWLAVGGDEDGLRALADRVEQVVTGSGLAADDRAFRAHLTLARVHRRATRQQRAAIAHAISALDAPAASPLHAKSLVLVRSYLGAGPVWHELISRHDGPGQSAR